MSFLVITSLGRGALDVLPSSSLSDASRDGASSWNSCTASSEQKDKRIAQLEEQLRLLKHDKGERLSIRDASAPAATYNRRMSEALISPPSAPPSVPLECPCIDVYPSGISSDAAFVVDILGESFSYPPRYGLNCSAHDAGLRPYCDVTIDGAFSPLDNPRWCSRSWCYVNASACNIAFSGSHYTAGYNLSYSYDT